jgi:chromosome segregation ATPase
MKNSRKTYEDENDQLLQEVKDTRSKVTKLEGMLLNVTRERSGLKQQLEEFKEKLLQTKEENTVMERKYSENLRVVEKLKTNERSTEKTREELRAKVAQLQDELETRYDRYMMTFWSNVGCLNQETLFARHVTQR